MARKSYQAAAVRPQVRSQVRPQTYRRGERPPNTTFPGRKDALAILKPRGGGLEDFVGESVILYQSGDASTWATTAVWGFEYSAELAAVDTALGGGVLFTGTDPIYRTYAAWLTVESVNIGYLWIGSRGIAVYSTDQADSDGRILRYLGFPSWLPNGATLFVDFALNKFWWNNEEKSISDLSVIGDQYYLDYSPDISQGAFVVIDWALDHSPIPSGQLFSWTSGYPLGNRIEVGPTSNGIDYSTRSYISPTSTGADYQVLPMKSIDGEVGGVTAGSGIHRTIADLTPNTLISGQPDNGGYRSLAGITTGALATPTRFGFGCRAWNSGTPGDPIVNGSMTRAVLINKQISAAAIDALGRDCAYPPIHLLGDSILTNYTFSARLREESGIYLPYSQDGVGGSTLTEQAARFAANNEKWHDSTLVIYNYGHEEDYAGTVTAINSILSNLNHNRWLFIEPTPSVATGEAGRDTWDATVASIKAAYPNNFVDTLSIALASGDNSAEDNAEVAKGLWPLSLKVSTEDFHTSEAGRSMLAEIIAGALRQRGWHP